MAQPDLHIIAFAVPYPATYGGAIDVWNRIRALHRAGVNITLHCFVYGPFGQHDALKEVAKEVYYYPRITWPALLSPGLPYIVSSRKNPLLLTRLSADKVPVLFEGIHTTGYLDDLKDKKRLLRSHNIEHRYYNELAKDSQRFQYLFFQREALALQRYERNNAKIFDTVFSIAREDTRWYQEMGASSIFVPAFHGIEESDMTEGRGHYLLYQGDLSIESNQRSVRELVKNIPAESKYPFIIAGRTGDKIFEDKLMKYPNIRREVDVTEGKMNELIKGAQVVIIHSRHSSGMKVKLFPALYHGRFIIANENSLTNSPVDKAFHIYKDVKELGPLLENIWNRDFTAHDIVERKGFIAQLPSDDEKAKEIMRYL